MCRLVLMGVAAAIAVTQGACVQPCGPRAGWSFQMGRPAVFNSPSLLSPSITQYGLGGVATMPTLGAGVAVPSSFSLDPAFVQPGQFRAPAPSAFAVDPCAGITLEELCRRLIELEKRVTMAPPAKSRQQSKPMPSYGE